MFSCLPIDRIYFFNYFNNSYENEADSYHFAWIRNLSRLVTSRITKSKFRAWICDRCLCQFKYQNSLKKHIIDCTNLNKCRVILPDENENFLIFKNF